MGSQAPVAMLALAAALLCAALLAPQARAHGLPGPQSQEDAGRLFELGVGEEAVAGTPTLLSLAIHDATDEERLLAASLWISVSQGDDVLLSSGDFYAGEQGPLFLSLAFPKEGNYTIDVAADGAQASFSIEVGPAAPTEPERMGSAALFSLAAVAGGAIAAWLVLRRRAA